MNQGNQSSLTPLIKNGKTSALGIAQFVEGTWLGEAKEKTSYLHDYISRSEKLSGKKLSDSKILALSKDPEVAIREAASYDGRGLKRLGEHFNLSILNDAEKSKVAYLIHHEGVKGARQFISESLTEDRATYLIKQNLKGESLKAGLAASSKSDYYVSYFGVYIDRRVQPNVYQPSQPKAESMMDIIYRLQKAPK